MVAVRSETDRGAELAAGPLRVSPTVPPARTDVSFPSHTARAGRRLGPCRQAAQKTHAAPHPPAPVQKKFYVQNLQRYWLRAVLKFRNFSSNLGTIPANIHMRIIVRTIAPLSPRFSLDT